MTFRPTTIERAYELARAGDCAHLSDIRARLKREGFADVPGQISGPTLLSALRRLCVAARTSPVAEG
jgi:hypothetical protein